MEQPDQAQKPKSYWRKPENWVASITMILVATYTGFQIWQTFLIRSNNIVSEQAFVLPGPPQPSAAIDAKDGVTKLVLIAVPLMNSGNTPTQGLSFLIRCAPSVDALPEPWVLLNQGPTEHVPQVIGPHAEIISVCRFTLDQINSVANGTLHAYLLGDIQYRDRLDPAYLHRSQLDLEIFIATTKNDPAGQFFTMQTTPVGGHNCADDECPASN